MKESATMSTITVPIGDPDDLVEVAARLYPKLAPHLRVVSLKFDDEYGFIPGEGPGQEYLFNRGAGVEHGFAAPKIMANGYQALVWDKNLSGAYPHPTFYQFFLLLESTRKSQHLDLIHKLKEKIDG
jgi:hypothetical protein